MQAHDSDIYFDDIKMQMVAKRMANPKPKTNPKPTPKPTEPEPEPEPYP